MKKKKELSDVDLMYLDNLMSVKIRNLKEEMKKNEEELRDYTNVMFLYNYILCCLTVLLVLLITIKAFAFLILIIILLLLVNIKRSKLTQKTPTQTFSSPQPKNKDTPYSVYSAKSVWKKRGVKYGMV